jgi:hypothetical protein
MEVNQRYQVEYPDASLRNSIRTASMDFHVLCLLGYPLLCVATPCWIHVRHWTGSPDGRLSRVGEKKSDSMGHTVLYAITLRYNESNAMRKPLSHVLSEYV